MLILKKNPSVVNETNTSWERKYFDSKDGVINEIHSTIGTQLFQVRHPTLKNVTIIYADKSNKINNFRLSYNGQWIKGVVYFVNSEGKSLTEEDCDKVIHSMKRYIITKEYIAGAK